ncbi:MAG: hypothetical protein GEU99_03420 [Luteitalea sp.]|nr:hypothetical protein [Luteitalea sp.]
MATERMAGTVALMEQSERRYLIKRYRGTRYWQVLDPSGELVCLTVYRRGAAEVVRRLGT